MRQRLDFGHILKAGPGFFLIANKKGGLLFLALKPLPTTTTITLLLLFF